MSINKKKHSCSVYHLFMQQPLSGTHMDHITYCCDIDYKEKMPEAFVSIKYDPMFATVAVVR